MWSALTLPTLDYVRKSYFKSMSNVFDRTKRVNKNGEKEVKVKPYLDSIWMTETELRVDAESPSQFTMKPKSAANTPRPQLGVLTVELLEMEGLRAADFISQNSDPYAVFVFEDCCAKTEYISNCLRPLWPHKSRRAARFAVTTAASTLYVGVFDYDAAPASGLEEDDPLGRVEIKLSGLRPMTEYDVWYPLQHSSLSRLKDERGFIRLRLNLDWMGNDRKIVTGYLKPQENLYFSVESHKMWKSCLYCISGQDIGDDYNWKIFMTYYNEINGYINLFSKPLQR